MTDFLDLFEHNRIVKQGEAQALGEPVDLGKLKCPAFVVGAVTDHLTPWKACYKASRHLGAKDITFALSNGGHVAALVNPPGNPKAYHHIAPATAPDADTWLEIVREVAGQLVGKLDQMVRRTQRQRGCRAQDPWLETAQGHRRRPGNLRQAIGFGHDMARNLAALAKSSLHRCKHRRLCCVGVGPIRRRPTMGVHT